MDSEVLRDGRILDLIDDAWREDKLPYEDVAIPLPFLELLTVTYSRQPQSRKLHQIAVERTGCGYKDPQNELPEPEQDNGGTTESVKEQEMKWTDLALQYLHENVPPTGN
ncbi:anaphase-promoting complex subunit 13 isoform X1 [Melopsittacus undulatus]|uniref:Anaphase-promoting complex subunit 13 n=1 Tax=Melopsittacus undulatus TaxID=13146 RepID=A0A8C6IZ92_MELUD|nr:anaphase-promoting complex subunit 13 isoform X1 [Melopsittacus undulatus]